MRRLLAALLIVAVCIPAFARTGTSVSAGLGVLSTVEFLYNTGKMEFDGALKHSIPSMLFIPYSFTVGFDMSAYWLAVENGNDTLGIGLGVGCECMVGDGQVNSSAALAVKYTHIFNGNDGFFVRTAIPVFGRWFDGEFMIWSNPVVCLQNVLMRETRIGYVHSF